jgi:predicted PurR-regulated permease PerM
MTGSKRAAREDPPAPHARRDRQELRSSATVIGVVLALTIFVYLVREILLPFVFAGILAYIFTPLVDRLAERTAQPRWIFATATLAALVCAGAAAGYVAIPQLVHEIVRVGGDLHGTVTGLVQRFIGDGTVTLLGVPINAQHIGDSVQRDLHDWLSEDGRVASLAALGFAGMFGIILACVLLGYFLVDARNIAHGLFWLVPPHHRPFVHRVWAELDPILRRYFAGVALVIIYASLAAYFGLGLILGLHHALLLAASTGVLEAIPIVGPAAAAIIAGLVAVQEAKSSWNILAYVVYAIALRVSIDEFFGPIVLGKAAYVRPALVIFCFLAGGLLFGVVGVVLAIPVALTIKTSLHQLYEHHDDAP